MQKYAISQIENLAEVKDRLRLIMDSKKAKAADKEFITSVAELICYNVTLPENPCPSCWVDLAIELLSAISAAEKMEDGSGHYILREGTDVIFGSIRVNEAMMTDEIAQDLLANGFDPSFFIAMP